MFINDLIKSGFLPVFEPLFYKLKHDTGMYEIKLTLVTRLLPAMSSDQIEQLMKIFEEVLTQPPENSIFRNNINPLRIAL